MGRATSRTVMPSTVASTPSPYAATVPPCFRSPRVRANPTSPAGVIASTRPPVAVQTLPARSTAGRDGPSPTGVSHATDPSGPTPITRPSHRELPFVVANARYVLPSAPAVPPETSRPRAPGPAATGRDQVTVPSVPTRCSVARRVRNGAAASAVTVSTRADPSGAPTAHRTGSCAGSPVTGTITAPVSAFTTEGEPPRA